MYMFDDIDNVNDIKNTTKYLINSYNEIAERLSDNLKIIVRPWHSGYPWGGSLKLDLKEPYMIGNYMSFFVNFWDGAFLPSASEVGEDIVRILVWARGFSHQSGEFNDFSHLYFTNSHSYEKDYLLLVIKIIGKLLKLDVSFGDNYPKGKKDVCSVLHDAYKKILSEIKLQGFTRVNEMIDILFEEIKFDGAFWLHFDTLAEIIHFRGAPRTSVTGMENDGWDEMRDMFTAKLSQRD